MKNLLVNFNIVEPKCYHSKKKIKKIKKKVKPFIYLFIYLFFWGKH